MIGFGNTPVRFGQGMIFGGLRREAPGYSPQPLIHPESGIDANPYIRLIQQYEPKGLVNPAQDVSSKPYINPAVDVSPKPLIHPYGEIVPEPYKSVHNPHNVNWNKVNTYMKRKGYDYRGAEDARSLFDKMSKGWSRNWEGDHDEALKYGSTKRKITSEGKAARYFGLTNNFEEAGYITPSGKMLDFSGRKQGYVGPPSRNLDHREINNVLDYDNDKELKDLSSRNDPYSNSVGMIHFMNLGNIRLQTDGIDISGKPTPQQQKLLIRHILKNSGGNYYVDISDRDGYTVKTFNYEWPNVSPYKVLQDIDSHFSLTDQPNKGSRTKE